MTMSKRKAILKLAFETEARISCKVGDMNGVIDKWDCDLLEAVLTVSVTGRRHVPNLIGSVAVTLRYVVESRLFDDGDRKAYRRLHRMAERMVKKYRIKDLADPRQD